MAVKYDSAHPEGTPIGPSCPAYAGAADGSPAADLAKALSAAETKPSTPAGEKKCRVCKQRKPLSQFSSWNGSFANVCDECRPSESTKLYGAAAKSRAEAIAKGTAKPKPDKPATRVCRACGETKPKAEFPVSGINANLCHACREKQIERAAEAEAAKEKAARKPKVDPVKSAAGKKGKEATLRANPGWDKFNKTEPVPSQEPVQEPKPKVTTAGNQHQATYNALVEIVRSALAAGLDMKVTIGANQGAEG